MRYSYNFKKFFFTYILFIGFSSVFYAQIYKPFTTRYSGSVKGNMLLVSNNILGKDNNDLNDNSVNENVDMKYIDIDSDPSTFSSSSATLAVPSGTTCYRVLYAGLYWSAILNSGSRTDINKVKFKLPGASSYTDVTGSIIYDAIAQPIITNNETNTPYACYADVTSLISGLANAQGVYTVANVLSSQGLNGSTGFASGWTLAVVYEDPKTNARYINSFDGFVSLYNQKTLTFPVSGFLTPSSGIVNLEVGFAMLGGDKQNIANKIEISNKAVPATLERPSNKFFNSSITDVNGYLAGRVPNSTNTLGYDAGLMSWKNAAPSGIGFGATSANMTLQIAQGQANPLFDFFNVFAVDIVAPDIALTKVVKDISGADVGGANVVLGQDLYYEIAFQNLGSDNVTNMTIKDVLPNNVIFNYPADITSLPAGVTHTYNATTRTLIFTIPSSLVEINDPKSIIKLHVKVAPTCNDLSDACSNKIQNQAFATYQGVINTTVIKDEGSFSNTVCNFGEAQPTNFLVKIDGCTFTKNEVLCGNSVLLTASNGYDSYSWSKDPSGTPVLPGGTGQTYTATSTGVYYVHTATTSCIPIVEQITVVPFGNTITNPVIPFADKVEICPNDGKEMPNIFLCGGSATRNIQTSISDASTIVWEKLNESSCPPIGIASCSNGNSSCTWTQVGTGPNYTANTAGQFRIRLTYPGGCFSIFYFNVYQNLLNPTETHRDIICNTQGNITIGAVPAGYEYSLDGTNYQTSNVFPITTAGNYTVYIRQVGVPTNPCIFTIPNILIQKRNFTASTIVTQPLCYGEKGTIKIAAYDAYPQYYYSLTQGATSISTVGPVSASDYSFPNLNPGTYTVRVKTDDGCDYSETITITEPALLTATSSLTKPLTCTDGEVTVYPSGGTPPYAYYVNGSTTSQSIPVVTVPNPGGLYNIEVVDSHNCKATTSKTVSATPSPVYAVNSTNVLCYGDTTGVIQFDVTSNAGGYTLSYSIDGGTTYSNNPVFSGLVAGIVYTPKMRYTLDGVNYCYDTKPTITLTGPGAAVTASAGVSELAGCGPAGEGKIRITNPQGGVAPYEYSFDNQATWITANEAYKAPGTYTVYIRDTNGCIFAMPNIVIDPKPTAPTIDVTSPVFNCNGTANSTVTITNQGGTNYQYGYLLDGTANTNVPPNVFVNVPSGSHIVSVTYKLTSVSTYSNLLNEDFGSGVPTTTSGIATAYCFNDQHVNPPYACGTRSVEDNQYSVASDFWRSDDPNGTNAGAWYHFKDHTTNGANPKGRFLLVNIGSAAGPNGVLYSKPIVDVIPNQPVKVDFYVANLLKSGINGAAPDILVQLVDSSNNVVAQQYTGLIANAPNDPNRNKWVPISFTLNPGNNNNLKFVVRSGSVVYSGNDVVIDDIRVYQLPKSCITQVDFPFEVPTGKAFNASVSGFKNVSCAGANDGQITIAVQNYAASGYYYSLDGAAFQLTTASPLVISALSPGSHSVQVKYDQSASPCLFTLPQSITAPTALTVTASVTTQATCTTGATIKALGGGGTPAYQYELRQSDGTTVIIAFNNNASFTNVPAGNYTVFAKDANGCTTSVGAAVNVIAPPTLTATLDPSSDLCYDPANKATLVVTVTGGTAPFAYSLNGQPAQTSDTFIDVVPGTHNILVTDSKNCTTTIDNVIIAKQLIATNVISKDLDCSASPDAIISGTITEGTAPFVVTLVSGTGPGTITQPTSTTFTYTTSVASTYTFKITDKNGCSTTTTATINAITNPTVTETHVNPLCNGVSNGSVTLIGAGGSGGYTYSKDNVSFGASNLFTGLAPGSYTFYIKDSKSCPGTVNVTLTNPAIITPTVTTSAFSCSTTNTKQSATISVSATGGSGTFTYSFNNGTSFSSSNSLTVNDNGAPQSFDIIVKDGNGCLSTVQHVDLVPLNPPTITGITGTPIYCSPAASTTSTVTVTATNGVGTKKYEITSPAASVTLNTTGVFSGLAGGITYTFKVTDANGCFAISSFNVPVVTPIAVVATKLTDVACFGDSTGSIKYTVSGFTGKYSYSVNGAAAMTGQSAPTFTLPNLPANTYSVVFTDETTNCIAPTSITITQPTNPLLASVTSNVNANCKTPFAVVTISASGGTPGYTYAFVQDGVAPTTYIASNVGNLDPTVNTQWDVWVKDNKGCTFKIDVVVAKDPSPTVTASVNNQCSGSGSTFQIKAVGAGGVTPYTYTINTGVAPTGPLLDTFTVPAGTYTITVKDKNGCTNTTSVTVNQALTATAIVTKDITCSTPKEGVIKIDVLGGKLPFGYRVKIGAGSFSGAPIAFAGTSFNYTATSLTGTTYQFEITDGNGTPCTTLTNVVSTNDTTPVTASYTKADPTCNGFSDGSIKLTALTGVSPYTYSIDNGAFFSTANVFGGLSVGTYNYIVRDKKGCDANGVISLNNPNPIVVDIVIKPIVCNSNTPGSLDVSVISGGVEPFKYTLYDNVFKIVSTYVESGASPTVKHSFTGLNFGDYYITVVDAKGCEFNSGKLRIETPPYLQLTGSVNSNNCATGVNVTVATSGGVAPYKYSIFGQPLTETAATASPSYTFLGLSHGTTYNLQVKDANNCISILEFTTPPSPSGIKITGTSFIDVTCYSTSTGTLNFSVQGYDATVTNISYQILNALTLMPLPTPINGTLTGAAGGPVSHSITTLPAGNYVLQVKEVSGTQCSAAYTFSINQPAQQLISSIASVVNANCNSGALVTLQTTGGTGPYTYKYEANDNPTDPILTSSSNVLNLDYTVGKVWNITVTDANGCTVPLNTTITKDPSPVITLSVVDKCVAEGNFGINITESTAGTGVYSLSVDGGTFTSIAGLPYVVTGLNSGGHTIIIKDENGCTNTQTITIDAPLKATPTITLLPTCANNDGKITMAGSGGTGTYSYSISPVAGNIVGNVISNLPAGTYTITMTDTATPTNCSTTASVTLGAPTSVTFTTTTKPTLCVGDANGSITVILNATNDNPNYTYEITAGPQLAAAQPSNVFQGLLAGTYTVKVTSGRGCSLIDNNVVVNPATPLIATTTITTPLSCGTSNVAQKAIVTVTGSGGSGTYEYSFDGVNYSSKNTFESYISANVTGYVRDANGCVASDSKLIKALNPPTNMDISGTPIYCMPAASQTSTVTINGVANGVSPFTYQNITLGTSSATGVFSGLTDGIYTFQVTDSNGCKYQESYTVDPVTNITVAGQLLSNITCNGGTNGQVMFTVSNFAGNYTYSFDGGAISAPQNNTTITFSGLNASPHTINITDVVTGCTATASVTVIMPTSVSINIDSNIPANCKTGAQVSITASGGTPSYTYSFVVSGQPAGTYSSSPSAVLDPTVSTAWDIYVKDANGCPFGPFPVTITTDPLPAGFTASAVSQCPSSTGTYDITVTPGTGMGPFEYSIGSGFQTSPAFTVNVPKTYDLIVKDKFGCITTFPAVIPILQPIALQATIMTLPSCTNNDGSITAAATGGSGNYSYQLDGGTAVISATANFTGIASGNHTVLVTDTTTNCTDTATLNLKAATLVTGLTLSKTPVTCNGGNDGTITATLATPAPGVNDNPVYMYSLNGGTPQSSNLFSGLATGNYTVDVVSGRGCPATSSIFVDEPAIITVNPTVAQFDCSTGNTTNFATITVDPATGVTGGSGTYTIYEFVKNGTSVQIGSSNTYTESDFAGGSYIINVFDDKGCQGNTAAPIVINPFISLDKINVVVNKAITCNNLEDITVTVSSIGGTPTNLQYTLVDKNATTGVIGGVYPSQTNTTGVFTLLPVANYLITVKNLDTNCEIQDVHYVFEPNTFDLIIDNFVDVTCFGDANGSANVTIVDKTITATDPDQAGAFTYTLVDSLGNSLPGGTSATAGPKSLTNLAAGTYTITATLTNSPFCSVSKAFTINGPTTVLKISETHTEITCVTGNNDGTISVNAIGGWPGDYEFELSGPINVAYSTQTDFTNLTAGLYTIKVRDSKGCVKQVTVNLSNPTPIVAAIVADKTIVNCFGDTSATITVQQPVAGGSGIYNYTLEATYPNGTVTLNGPQASNVFDNLGAGSYKVIVSDTWSCSAPTNTVVINQPTVVQADLVIATTQTCLNQTQLTLAAKGGTAPYTYSDSVNGTYSSTFDPSVTISVPAGTYHYYVKDVNGCMSVVSNDITIDPLPVLKVNLDLSDAVVNCQGESTASITAIAEGGLGNYQYTLFDGSNNSLVGPQPTGVFSGLGAGTYYVSVQSGVDCNAVSTTVNLTDPPLLQIVNPVIQTDVLCNGDKNGAITINTTGGTGTIQFAISPNLNQFFSANSSGGFTFTDLAAGTYQVLVQDQAGCFILRNVTINEPAVLDATVANVQQELCKGDKNGQFTVNITGGTQPYFTNLTTIDGTVIKDYTQVSGSAQTYSGLAGGQMYIINIKDKNNCQTGQIAVLNAPTDLQISKVDVAYNCTGNVPGNTVTVSIVLNSPGNVTYSLDGTNYQPGSVFTNVASGTYTVYVKHDNGCIKTQSVTIDPKTPISANVSNIINATCNGSATGSITVNTSGGTSPLQYAISPNFAYQNGNVFNNLKAGTYDIKVKDDIGCEVTLSNNTITEPTVVVVSLNTAVQELCKGDGNGSITVNISGGVSPYQTSIDGITYNLGQLTYSNLTGGQTYTIYVKDANGCSPTTQFSYALNAAVDLQLSLTSSDQCTGNAPSHTITASVNSALNPSDVSYSLDGTNYQPSNLFPNLTDGTYTVYAKHSNGCIKQQTITIAPKLPVMASISNKVDVICNGSSTGSITVTGAAGTPPYQYAISPNFAYGSTNVFNNLVAGTYEIRVKDAIGCEVILKDNTTTITEPTAIIATVTNVVQEICAGDKSGSITITVSGGVSPYSTSLSQNGSYVQDQFTFSNLSGGKTYIVYIKDANNCLVQTSTTLDAPIDIKATVTVNYDCTKHTAVVKVNPTVVNDVTYSLDNGTYQPSNIFDNIQPGNHLISVKHNNNQCFNTVSFNVKAIQPLTLTLEQSGINEFTATAQGGSGIYTYTVNGENIGSQNVVKIHHSGTYVVIVTDTNDCTAQQSIEMTFVDVAFPDNFTPNADGYDDTWAPTNTRDYPNLVTDVFDRYGRKIAILRINDSWDGKYHGEPLPTGDYWYIVKLGAEGDNREYVGHFTLYR